MVAKLTLRGEEFEVRAGLTVLQALKQVGIQPEAVIATRDGELITEDEVLRDDDVIQLVAVISGGQ